MRYAVHPGTPQPEVLLARLEVPDEEVKEDENQTTEGIDNEQVPFSRHLLHLCNDPGSDRRSGLGLACPPGVPVLVTSNNKLKQGKAIAMEGQKHTAGSVALAPHSKTSVVAEKRLVAACGGYSSNVWGEDAHGENEANARRVAACWNACAGVSTEALESWLVDEMAEALQGTVRYLESLGQAVHRPTLNAARTLLARYKANPSPQPTQQETGA